MVYKYCENRNFEDFASGRVLLHRTGYPNFPVRLAQEVFCRCMERIGSPEQICIYDPCCGGGYLLTVLGFLNYGRIGSIAASDISAEAVELARENLSLLCLEGLRQRIEQLGRLRDLHGKSSSLEALESAENLLGIVTGAARGIELEVFQADILSPGALEGRDFKADIVFTDVPYGNLVEWQEGQEDALCLPDRLLPVIKDTSVVAVCSDKRQKFRSDYFRRLEKQAVGKRLFQIFVPA